MLADFDYIVYFFVFCFKRFARRLRVIKHFLVQKPLVLNILSSQDLP